MIRRLRTVPVSGLALAAAVITSVALGPAAGTAAASTPPGQDTGAITPVQHLVVMYQENVSFDHYFATYPHAANPAGEPPFDPSLETPSVNGLNGSLLAPNNPNAVQPFRLDRSQFETRDQDHNYTDEQKAFDAGLMDMFVEKVGRGTDADGVKGGQVMGYYDGNTVTALWSCGSPRCVIVSRRHSNSNWNTSLMMSIRRPCSFLIRSSPPPSCLMI